PIYTLSLHDALPIYLIHVGPELGFLAWHVGNLKRHIVTRPSVTIEPGPVPVKSLHPRRMRGATPPAAPPPTAARTPPGWRGSPPDRKSTRLNSSHVS